MNATDSTLIHGTSGSPQLVDSNYDMERIAEQKALALLASDTLDNKAKGKYPGGRTYKEYVDLARDPSHGNKVLYQGRKERQIGLDLEKQGLLNRIIRDPNPNGGAEFIDTITNIKWDIKSFVSYPKNITSIRKGAFNVNVAVNKILKEASKGHNIILDTRRLTKAHITELKQAIDKLNLNDKIIWYTKKGK